jgi:hypothetical protein
MGKTCKDCGKNMSFLSILSSVERCEDCEKKFQIKQIKKANELNELKGQLILSKEISLSQLELLKQQKKEFLIKYYQEIVQELSSDKELSLLDLGFLLELQEGLNLTDEEVQVDELILPHVYVAYIKEYNKLPTFDNINFSDGSHAILKKDEKIYHQAVGIVQEIKTTHSYAGGSQGVSIRITKGVYYRVGAHQGQIKPVQSLVETSRGTLIFTNKRLLLHPVANNKPLSIPLNKIISFHCYSNGLEIYIEGKENGFFFTLLSPGQNEIAGIVLNFLIERLE